MAALPWREDQSLGRNEGCWGCGSFNLVHGWRLCIVIYMGARVQLVDGPIHTDACLGPWWPASQMGPLAAFPQSAPWGASLRLPCLVWGTVHSIRAPVLQSRGSCSMVGLSICLLVVLQLGAGWLGWMPILTLPLALLASQLQALRHHQQP